MTILILPFLVDAEGCDAQAFGDPVSREWPGDCGPIVGDRIPPCVPGLGELTVRSRRWVPAGATVALTVRCEGRAVEVAP